MPYYGNIKYIAKKGDRQRLLDNLQQLRQQLTSELPERTTDKSLVLGTWNIRNFDDNRFGYGPRLQESLHYMAEIISRFDVLAVQEICEDLGPLDEVMSLLGRDYRYIITDMTDGSGGNRERLGFIYNRNKVHFKGVAGEIVLPEKHLISSATKKSQFSRTPFACSFQSGWFKFMFATVHIYFGKASKKSAGYKKRVAEINKVAQVLSRRAKKEDYNYVLVGDFNIVDFDGPAYDALQKHGFKVFKNKTGSNSNLTTYYDQISFRTRPNELRVDEKKGHGVFNFFENLFNESHFDSYKQILKTGIDDDITDLLAKHDKTKSKKIKAACKKKITKKKALKNSNAKLLKYFMEWRTFQLSDHMPLWVELEIDFSGEYLDYLKTL